MIILIFYFLLLLVLILINVATFYHLLRFRNKGDAVSLMITVYTIIFLLVLASTFIFIDYGALLN